MRLTAWIIDDDLVSQFATEYSVKQTNHEIISKSFDNASESLEALKECFVKSEGIPDIILLDLIMPEMDGWEFLDQVKNIADFEKNICVFVISSFAKSKDRDLAKKHPMVRGYYDKPLSKVSVDQIFQSLKVNDQ